MKKEYLVSYIIYSKIKCAEIGQPLITETIFSEVIKAANKKEAIELLKSNKIRSDATVSEIVYPIAITCLDD